MITTLFSGIVISLLIGELTGYSPGGIVVAGYLAQFIFQPVWLGGTLAIAFITHGIVKILENRLLLYGRRQFALYILIGMAASQAAMSFSVRHILGDTGLLVIGYLIPGLLARDFARQGIVTTLLVTALAVILTYLVALAGEGMLWW